MKNNFLKVALIFSILLLVGACTAPLGSRVVNTVTPKALLTPTVLPTRTETLQSSTQTSVPTLTSQEANTEIQRLLSGEKDCSFPCWWGLMPSQTQIVDVKNLLEQFNTLSIGTPKLSSKEGYIRLISPQAPDSYLHLTFIYKGQEDILERLWLRIQMMHKVTDADGSSRYEVSWDDPRLPQITKPYNLSHVLAKYGMPSEVSIRTYKATLLNQPWPISLVVYYPDKGFAIEYVANGEGAPNSTIAWCPLRAFPNFWFWSPSNGMTLSNVVSGLAGEQLDRESVGSFKTIKEATGMSIEEFYSVFKNDEDKCVETPTKLWPMPGQ